MSVNPSTLRYSLDGGLPSELTGAVDPGTNLLVSGAAMTGKQDLLFRLLAEGADQQQGAMVVTTRKPATALVDEYRSRADDQPVWFVDCVGGQADGDTVRSVGSPGDLTGIGIEFSEVAQATEGAGVERVRVGVDSLSPLLLYSDLQRVFRFLHVFTSQIQSRNWLGIFLVDPESHEDRAVNTLRQLFDGLIELRVEDGVREARTRGVGESTSEWVAFEE